MSAYPDLDDLFSPATPVPSAPTPPPMPMPMPLPMPAAPAPAANIPAPHGTERDSVPPFTGEQMRDLWVILKTVAAAVSATPPQPLHSAEQLLRQFLQRHGASLALASPARESSPERVHDKAIATQLELKANPPPLGARISHSRNKAGANRIHQYDWYDSFPVRKNWLAAAPDGTAPVPIRYNKFGELQPSLHFNRASLEAYIRGCARQGIPLRLWVQNSVTVHTERFPTAASYACRAECCPIKSGTIGRGMLQVSLDEHPTETSNGRFDPFHVAGYLHLFCLEEMLPMAELMTFADVQADVRALPLEERNPMSLARSGIRGQSMLHAFRSWKHHYHDQHVQAGRAVPTTRRRSSTQRLYKYLTVKKMEAEPNTRQRMRDQRNGFDISKYQGNLRKLVAFREDARKKRKRTDWNDDASEDGMAISGPNNDNTTLSHRTASQQPLQPAAPDALPLLDLGPLAGGGGGGGEDFFSGIDVSKEDAEAAMRAFDKAYQDSTTYYAEQEQQLLLPQQTMSSAAAHYNLRDTQARRRSMERYLQQAQVQQQPQPQISFEDGGLFIGSIDPALYLHDSPIDVGGLPPVPPSSPQRQAQLQAQQPIVIDFPDPQTVPAPAPAPATAGRKRKVADMQEQHGELPDPAARQVARRLNRRASAASSSSTRRRSVARPITVTATAAEADADADADASAAVSQAVQEAEAFNDTYFTDMLMDGSSDDLVGYGFLDAEFVL